MPTERAAGSMDFSPARRFKKGWADQKKGTIKPSPVRMEYENNMKNIYNYYKYVILFIIDVHLNYYQITNILQTN